MIVWVVGWIEVSRVYVCMFVSGPSQIKEREKAQAEKEKDDGNNKGGPSGGGGSKGGSAPPLPKAPDIKLPDGGLWG